MKTDTSPYYSEFFNQLHADGVAEGEAKALPALLRACGLDVPAAVASEITACTDTARLTDWVTRAATANALDEVFGDLVQ